MYLFVHIVDCGGAPGHNLVQPFHLTSLCSNEQLILISGRHRTLKNEVMPLTS